MRFNAVSMCFNAIAVDLLAGVSSSKASSGSERARRKSSKRRIVVARRVDLSRSQDQSAETLI